MAGWIGVDLDGTVAEHHGDWVSEIGPPIEAMALRVRNWLREGKEVRIFTARASDPRPEVIWEVERWCRFHLGRVLPVTNAKDYEMIELWDDRAVQVIRNTGERVGDLEVLREPDEPQG